MEKFELNKEYSFKILEDFVIKSHGTFVLEEYGINVIGANFITISHTQKDIVYSFVLTGASKNGYIYKCVYKN